MTAVLHHQLAVWAAMASERFALGASWTHAAGYVAAAALGLGAGALWNRHLRRVAADRALEAESKEHALQREIAERLAAEQRLRDSEATLRGFFNANEMYLAVLELDGDDVRFVLPNRRMAAFFGAKVPEFVGRRGRDLGLPPALIESWAGQLRWCHHAGQPALFEHPVHWRDREHWFQTSVSPILDTKGEVPRFSMAAVEITDRRRVEQALRDSEERLRLAQAAARIGTWDRNLVTGEITWSEQQADLFGSAVARLSFDDFLQHVHDEDRARVRYASERAVRERTRFRAEFRVVVPDGSVRWLAGIGRVIYDDAGRPVRMLGLNMDVTEHKAALSALRSSQDQLIEAQKMESVGRLAGGVAHDFNNLLTAILAYADLARRSADVPGPATAHLESIEHAATRASGLTRQLLAFARKQIIEPRAVDLNALVREIELMLTGMIGEDLDFVFEPAPALWPATVDPGQMEQILVNLAVNARDAMSAGGTLRIATSNVTLGAEDAAAAAVAPGDYVAIEVADNGSGMPDDVAAHVFEPFFTTKPKGQGTGLGLATCYGIVKQNGGHIDFTTAAGRGTTFRVLLPRGEGRPVPARETPFADEAPGGSETILLVEDEPSVREVTTGLLELLGYTVMPAEDGTAAIMIAERHAATIDLVLTDMVMPHMGGRELAGRLRTICPGARILFTSGYTDDLVFRQDLAEQDVAFLQKPFTTAMLARKVREVLDEPAPVGAG